jgi:ribosome-associated protein
VRKVERLRISHYCSTLGPGEQFTSLPRRSQTAPAEETTNWLKAVRCAAAKKATDIKVLDLKEVTSFTDYFVICSVANPRQAHAVCDEIEKGLKEIGERPVSVEGFNPGEWILMDYGDFLVHIFSSAARSFYDLERLWRHAKLVEVPEI